MAKVDLAMHKLLGKHNWVKDEELTICKICGKRRLFNKRQKKEEIIITWQLTGF